MSMRIPSAFRVSVASQGCPGWSVLAVGLALAGCGKGEDLQPSPELRLEVGTGRQFTALAEGDTLLVQRGCQNSQHAFVSLRAWGLPSDPVMVDLSLARIDDGQKVSLPYRVRYLFAQGADAETPDELPGLLLQVPDPAPVLGQLVRLTATVDTGSPPQATDSRTGPLQWGPDACP